MISSHAVGTTALAIVILANAAFAQPYFHDDFEDLSIDDGMPVSWNDGGVGGGNHNVLGGDLVITPDANNLVASAVTGLEYNDVAVRTQLRVSGPEFREAGVFVRGVDGVGTYRAGITGDQLDGAGPSGVFIIKAFTSTISVLGSAMTTFDAAQTDVFLELEATEDSLNLTVWPEAQPKPTTPQVSVRDSSFAQGSLGVYFISDRLPETSGTFRFFTALPDPSGVPGDYTNSGLVEQADLDLVLRNWGASSPPAVDGWVYDQPTDGTIDQDDLDSVLLNWGNSVAATNAVAVPEPATGFMLVLCAAAILASRRTVGARSKQNERPL